MLWEGILELLSCFLDAATRHICGPLVEFFVDDNSLYHNGKWESIAGADGFVRTCL